MRVRLTPLNIITSLGFVLLALSFLQSKSGAATGFDTSSLYKIILGFAILVSIITDSIFRFLFKDLRRIWLVEMVFISLIVVIFLLLQK